MFAIDRFSGNQLAVLRSGDLLDEREMQKIAREINFSETAFILSGRGDTYEVRIFTPVSEVPFAGHPTLGTAHVILKEILHDAGKALTLSLKVGKITVSCEGMEPGSPVYWMKQMDPQFGRRFSSQEIAPVLGIDAGHIDSRFPVEEVTTGLPHIIVPLIGAGALSGIRIRDREYGAFMSMWRGPLMAFCRETRSPENQVSVRMFAPCLGVPEDPATGSGNGCLAGYLVRHRYFGTSSVNIRSEQGYDMGRPSLLHLKAEEINGRIDVTVGGTAITVARGEFLV